MKQKENIEEILSSLDGMDKAVAPDFFYTRLRAKMEAGFIPSVTRRPLLLRPVFVMGTLLLVMVINAVVIFRSNRADGNGQGDADLMQSIAAQYSLNNSITHDINQ